MVGGSNVTEGKRGCVSGPTVYIVQLTFVFIQTMFSADDISSFTCRKYSSTHCCYVRTQRYASGRVCMLSSDGAMFVHCTILFVCDYQPSCWVGQCQNYDKRSCLTATESMEDDRCFVSGDYN